MWHAWSISHGSEGESRCAKKAPALVTSRHPGDDQLSVACFCLSVNIATMSPMPGYAGCKCQGRDERGDKFRLSCRARCNVPADPGGEQRAQQTDSECSAKLSRHGNDPVGGSLLLVLHRIDGCPLRRPEHQSDPDALNSQRKDEICRRCADRDLPLHHQGSCQSAHSHDDWPIVAESVDDSTRHQRNHRGCPRHAGQEEARCSGTDVKNCQQVERLNKHDSQVDEVHHRRDDCCTSEHAVGEFGNIDERCPYPPLNPGDGQHHSGAGNHQTKRNGRSPTTCARVVNPDGDQCWEGRQHRDPPEVGRAMGIVVAAFRCRSQCTHEGNGSERKVEPEDVPPRQVSSEVAANNGTGNCPSLGNCRPDSQGSPSSFRRVGDGDQGQRRRCQQRGEQAHARAGCDR